MAKVYRIEGLDPLLFGDGRPFSSGEGARQAASLDMPLPGTIAGAARTLISQHKKLEFSRANGRDLLQVSVRGPLLADESGPLVLIPADAVHRRIDGKDVLLRLRPSEHSLANCDLPDGLRPMVLDAQQGEGVKNSTLRWLPVRQAVEWLLGADSLNVEEIPGPSRERRTHVGMNFGTQTGAQGKVFQTEGIGLGPSMRVEGFGVEAGPSHHLLCHIEADELPPSEVVPLGGERRLAVYKSTDEDPFTCPAPIRAAFAAKPQLVRLVLATPAAFALGWKPGWADQGAVPGTNVKLRLVAASVRRRQPVSGWDMDQRRPKPIRWLAPAGSVYFFEVVEGDRAQLADGWLQSVSDLDPDQQDQRDGFGLAMWGVWEPSKS